MSHYQTQDIDPTRLSYVMKLTFALTVCHFFSKECTLHISLIQCKRVFLISYVHIMHFVWLCGDYVDALGNYISIFFGKRPTLFFL